MKITNKAEYVERYLEGKLKEGDLWEFKVNLEKDQELAQELQLQQEIQETLVDTNKMQLRRTLNKAYLKTTHVYTIASTWKLQTAVAAAIVIMVLVGGGIMFNYVQTSGTTNMALYEEHFDTDNALFIVRSDETVVNNIINKGLEAYKNNDYLQAIMLFSENNDNMAANLYAGFSFMKLSDFENAQFKFEEIIKDNNNLFIDQAEFNLALCFVATNKLEKASEVLQAIVKENTAYSEKAQKLLIDINNK